MAAVWARLGEAAWSLLSLDPFGRGTPLDCVDAGGAETLPPERQTRSAALSRKSFGTILGHTYWLKAECDGCFIFETLDPPGTFVPPHIHPTHDEFIYMLEGTFDLYLDGSWTQAKRGDLVRMPQPARALFSVTPARVYVSCSINFTILLIPMRWFAALRSARLIFCRPAQCLGHDVAGVSSCKVASLIPFQGWSAFRAWP
jgi:hypothetical protein